MTIGSGRDFLESDTYEWQAQGLLERADPVPAEAVVEVRVDEITFEVQDVRVDVVMWVTT